MALIIEDGNLIPNATSYASIEFFRAYCTARGFAIPADDAEGDAEIETALIRGMDRIEAQAGDFLGEQYYPTQTLAFPRTGMYVYGRLRPYNTIPDEVRKAQCEYALAVLAGVDLLPTIEGAAIKREKVGPIDTEYVYGSAGTSAPVVQAAEAYLRILKYQGLRTVRV